MAKCRAHDPFGSRPDLGVTFLVKANALPPAPPHNPSAEQPAGKWQDLPTPRPVPRLPDFIAARPRTPSAPLF